MEIITSNIVDAIVPGVYGPNENQPPAGFDLLIFLDNSFVIDTIGDHFEVPQ